MNVLITGANGLLGKNLVELLSKENIVYALVRDKNNVKFKISKNINIIESDLSNFDITVLPKDVNAIYYLAQSNRFREFPDGANDMFEVNVNSPLKICQWGKENGVSKFIYASSGGVYTNPLKPVKEFFDINANEKQGFYLDSKLSAEILIKNFAPFFETFAIIRPFFIYGIGQNKTMLIPRLINSVIENQEITLNGENGIKINPIYVDDASKAIKNILNLSGEYIFNIAGDDVVSLKELSQKISEIVYNKPIYKINDTFQLDLIADNYEMKKMLHTPEVSIDEGLLKLYEDFLC